MSRRTPLLPSDPIIVAARRTAIGTAGHAFAGVQVTGLAAPVLAALAEQTAALGLPGRPDEVVLGNCQGPGGNLGRVAALAAGLGTDVPGSTVDRQCASGLDAIRTAAALIRAGEAGAVLAGGAESASTAPWRHWPPTEPGRPPVRYSRAPFAPPGFPDPEMGAGADALAAALGISRSRQDDYAARSHQLAAASAAAHRFAAEIVAVAGVDRDQRSRAGLTAARLARLPPAFGPGGTVTAGNSCGVSDGAAAVALVAARRLPELDRDGPVLRIVAGAVAADDPGLPGSAITPSVHRLLADPRAAGVGLADIGALEITEAFAAVALAAVDGLGLDRELVCADGGAIGLGHPWGASGAVLVVRLAARMLEFDGTRFGLAACATGGGQAVALLLERIDR